LTGVGYAGLIALSRAGHQVGQTLAGKLAGAPLSGVVFTPTLAYQLYPPDEAQSGRVHLMRALGGPLVHVVLAAGATALLLAGVRTRFVRFFAVLNAAFAAAS